MLQNTKSKGFTLVELLIVIVVIAILAAISIVAYNGIQNRGKASAAQSLASQVSKKAEAHNTIESSYPATVGDFADTDVSTLDDPSVVTATDPTDESTVRYRTCTTPAGSAQVVWYDATTSGLKFIGLGGASSTAACS